MTQHLTTRQEQIQNNIKHYLSDEDAESLMIYIASKPKPLALPTARAFYELFLTGSSIEDIQKINPSFSKEEINHCRVLFNWDDSYFEVMQSMQNRIASKVVKAQVEAASLYADTISVANKQHGYALKKYLQTNDESYLVGTLAVKSVTQLAAAVNGLQSLLKESALQDTRMQGKAPVSKAETIVEIEAESETLSPLERVAAKKREAGHK